MAKPKAKEIKKTDFFLEKTDLIVRYVLENRKQFYIGSGVVVALIILATGWFFYRMDYEKKAQNLFDQAFNYTHFSPPDTVSASQAVELYRRVVEKYPGSRSAAYAVFSMGNIYYRVNDLDGAIQAYEDFLRQSGARNELRSMAYNSLGYCYEVKGQTDRALEVYEKAAQDAMTGAFLASVYSNIARLYSEKKDSAKALAFYRRALEQKNEPLMEAMIKRKIAELDS